MVKAIIDIEDSANRILNIVKAKENLRDKSQALNLVLNIYGKEMLEPELRPEFVNEILKAQKEDRVKVADWDKHFKLK